MSDRRLSSTAAMYSAGVSTFSCPFIASSEARRNRTGSGPSILSSSIRLPSHRHRHRDVRSCGGRWGGRLPGASGAVLSPVGADGLVASRRDGVAAWRQSVTARAGEIRVWDDPTRAWGWTYQPDVLMLLVDPHAPELAVEVVEWFDDINTGQAPRVEVADGQTAVLDALESPAMPRPLTNPSVSTSAA